MADRAALYENMDADRLRHFLRLRDRQALQSRAFWVRAAKEALAGDMRSLRLRVEVAEAPEVVIVQS